MDKYSLDDKNILTLIGYEGDGFLGGSGCSGLLLKLL
jgi:hypothetical protein